MVGERSELLCLVSCIYLFFNKYNWLCVFFGGVGKENPALRPGGGFHLLLFVSMGLVKKSK